MKCLKSLLLTGAVLSGMIAFGQETITISEPIRQVEINDFKPTKDMVSMDGLRGDVTISIGDIVYYAAGVHGSVGYSTSVDQPSGESIEFQKREFVYDDPENAGLSGGDEGTEYYLFEAKEAGTSIVTVRNYFRGDLESEFKIKVTVVE